MSVPPTPPLPDQPPPDEVRASVEKLHDSLSDLVMSAYNRGVRDALNRSAQATNKVLATIATADGIPEVARGFTMAVLDGLAQAITVTTFEMDMPETLK